jgi:alcohol dehydrogenase
VAIGRDVSQYKVGDRVYGMKNPADGLATYAEDLVVAEKNVAHIPTSLTYLQAAGVPLCALTAWQALVNKAKIQSGMNVLIIGASGGVGSFAVQVAITQGARVAGVCSGENLEMVKGLGAHEVINYKDVDVTKGEAKFDIIFDCIGRYGANKCVSVLKPGGTHVSTIPGVKSLLVSAVTNVKSVFFPSTKKSQVVMVKPVGKDLKILSDLIEAGKIKPVIDRVFPLEEAADALDYSRSLRAKGKIILQVQ